MIKFNARKMFDQVVEDGGFEGYVDHTMSSRFNYLVELFNDFGAIEQEEEAAAIDEFKRILNNRLQLARDWAMNPQILQQEIRQPFFVVGNARAGTTFAQSILTLDDGHRTPCYWDTRNPSPPPGSSPESDHIAHEEAKCWLDMMLSKSPGLWQAHPYFDQGSFTEAEDEFLYSTDLNMAYPLHFLQVPTLPQAVPPPDPVEALQFLKKMYQQLQWKSPVKRWVGKGIIHQYLMPQLLHVFPDAACFWMHRPPEEYIASLLELLWHQYAPFNGHHYNVDPRAMVEQLHDGMSYFMSQPEIDDPRVSHIRFADFVKDPVTVVGQFYEQHHIPFTADYERRIKERVTDPAFRADRHGKFDYSLEKFGLNKAELRRKFGAYCERFEL